MRALENTLDRVQQVEAYHRKLSRILSYVAPSSPLARDYEEGDWYCNEFVLLTEYNELKSGLSDFLRQFAQEGKVCIKVMALLVLVQD